ncbi:hypothetical protein WA588_005218 [Blastocystis sp. NMH]
MNSLFSAKEVEKLKKYFAVLDPNHTGTISKNDAILIVRGMGIQGLDEEFNAVISGMSANESALTLDNVINIAVSMRKSQTNEYESVIQVFKMFDKNQDGTVMASDLRQILSHLGDVIPEDEIDSLLRSLGFGEVIKYEDLAKALLASE